MGKKKQHTMKKGILVCIIHSHFCLNQNYDLLKLAMMHLSSTMIFIKLMRSCIFEYLINVTFECTDHEFDMCVSWFNIYSV